MKWIFHNKQDDQGLIVRNRATLVASGFSQVEGLDFRGAFALVTRLEAILTLPTYASNHNIFKWLHK
jgi:hypothetical protein